LDHVTTFPIFTISNENKKSLKERKVGEEEEYEYIQQGAWTHASFCKTRAEMGGPPQANGLKKPPAEVF